MEWYQKLLEFASKEYDFDIDTFKIKYGSTFNDPEREIMTFNKNGKEIYNRFRARFCADKASNES